MDIKNNKDILSIDFSYLVLIQKIFIVGTYHRINIIVLYTIQVFKYFARYLHHEPIYKKPFYVVGTMIFNYNLYLIIIIYHNNLQQIALIYTIKSLHVMVYHIYNIYLI